MQVNLHVYLAQPSTFWRKNSTLKQEELYEDLSDIKAENETKV